MNCTDNEKLILLKESGELPPKQLTTLIQHMQTCKTCQQFEQMIGSCKNSYKATWAPSQDTIKLIIDNAVETHRKHKTETPIIVYRRPILALAASIVILLSLFVSLFKPSHVETELSLTETQLMDSEEQIVSVMYSGLSEDDLAFNYLMTSGG